MNHPFDKILAKDNELGREAEMVWIEMKDTNPKLVQELWNKHELRGFLLMKEKQIEDSAKMLMEKGERDFEAYELARAWALEDVRPPESEEVPEDDRMSEEEMRIYRLPASLREDDEEEENWPEEAPTTPKSPADEEAEAFLNLAPESEWAGALEVLASGRDPWADKLKQRAPATPTTM